MSPTMESGNFKIRRKDFPALPGNISSEGSSTESSWSDDSFHETVNPERNTPQEEISPPSLQRNIIISKEGKVSNIPPGMVQDQFGMVGILSFIRYFELNPNLILLTLGEDLRTYGLTLESSQNLHSDLSGPWLELSESNISKPSYKLSSSVRRRLAEVIISNYEDDLLFYLFYTQPRDVVQLVAAGELYRRGWRYHMLERIWVTPMVGGMRLEEGKWFQSTTFYLFDVFVWKKVIKQCCLDWELLEGPPILLGV